MHPTIAAGQSVAARQLACNHGPLLVACLPLLLAIGFHIVGPRERALTTHIERPSLVFDQYLVNLGTVPPDEYVHARFAFRNTGDEPVTIQELKPSCGCLNPKLDKTTYQPGESGEFFVRVATANESPGPQEYFVDVNYTDGQARTARTTFKVTLPKLSVSVAPKAVIFYQLGSGETTREIIVTDRRSRTLRPLDVGCEPMLAKVKLGDVRDLADGRREIHLQVTVVGNAPPGRQHAMVTLTTDDPVFPVIRVPVIVEGPPSPPLANAAASATPDGDSVQQ